MTGKPSLPVDEAEIEEEQQCRSNIYCATNYHRSCFFCVDFIYANYARERKFAYRISSNSLRAVY